MALRNQPALLLRTLKPRRFALSARSAKLVGDDPVANQPDSINQNVRKDTPNTDKQSSASAEEHKTGDDHPAKQPDYQAEPTRSTGIGGQGEVKGGKEGLDQKMT